MTEFEQKLIEAFGDIAKALRQVSGSIDDLSSTLYQKDDVDTVVIAEAIADVAKAIKEHVK